MSQGKKNRARGKRTQAEIAKKSKDCMNVGSLGGEDLHHPIFSIEIKNREKFVGTGFINQAILNCPEGKVPLVRIHMHNKRYSDDFILLRVKDFEDLCGGL